MRIRLISGAAALAALVLTTAVLAFEEASLVPMQNGWILPEDAATKKNPLTIDDKTLANGKSVYKSKCEKCHGPGGLGDGPDAEPDGPEEMNLTLAKRADRNPDGVVFYKVSNGRKKPKMPAFKEELSEEQIWAVVAHVQSLRKK